MAASRYFIVGLFFSACFACRFVQDSCVIIKRSAAVAHDTLLTTIAVPPPLQKNNNSLSRDTTQPQLPDYMVAQKIYRGFIGVRELTGRNDGPEIARFLRSVGLSEGHAYCAAFVFFCLDSAGVKTTINAWSPTAHNAKNLVWFKQREHKPPRPADVFCVWGQSQRRVIHTGFYDGPVNDHVYTTVEGNTNESGVAHGDGVYARRRSYNATYSITRWTNHP